MSCCNLSELCSTLTGFKIHSDPKRNRVDSNLFMRLINELSDIQNLIVDNQMFIAGLQIGRLQGDLVILMEQLEEKERGGK